MFKRKRLDLPNDIPECKADPSCAGTAVLQRVHSLGGGNAAKKQRCVRDGARRRKWQWAEFAWKTKCFIRHNKSRTFSSPFYAKTKGFSERTAIVLTNTLG